MVMIVVGISQYSFEDCLLNLMAGQLSSALIRLLAKEREDSV